MSYLIPIASTTSIGLVQAGTNISITSNGVISTTGGEGNVVVGSWSPSLVSSLTATGIVISTSTAIYSKAGQQISCYFDFTITAETGGGANGVITLTRLPFTSITNTTSSTGYVGSLYISYFTNMQSDTVWLSGGVISNSTTATMFRGQGGPRTLVNVTQDDIQATTRLVGTITYLSAS